MYYYKNKLKYLAKYFQRMIRIVLDICNCRFVTNLSHSRSKNLYFSLETLVGKQKCLLAGFLRLNNQQLLQL